MHRIHFTTIDSTNTWAKDHIEELPRDDWTVITADRQTAGRGQFNRTWRSPLGGLYVSFVYFLDEYPKDTGQIGQHACQAVIEAIGELGNGIVAEKKEPNDVLIDGRKVAGILCETVQVDEGSKIGVVIGIGLNVNVPVEELNQVDQPATSLSLCLGKEVELDTILENLLSRLKD